MKHSNLILCGVACFAFVCLFGTSCSKQPQGKTVITVEMPVPEAVDNAFDVIQTRLNLFGISDPTMQKLENGQIQIDLQGIQDTARLKNLLTAHADLAFWETYISNELIPNLMELNKKQPFLQLFEQIGNTYSPVIGTALYTDTAKINEILRSPAALKILPRDVRFAWEVKPVDETGQYFRLIALKAGRRGCPALNGDVITDARAEMNANYAEIMMSMNASGAREWARFTQMNIGRPIAIVLDGLVYTYPTVQSEITCGRSSIAGNFTEEEAKDLANVLKSGKMPAPVRILQIEVIEPAK